MDWLAAVQQLRHDGQPGVLVTVIEVRGHAPREPGAKMVVSREASWGSVGGGNLEATAVARARALISSGATSPETSEMTAKMMAHLMRCICSPVARDIVASCLSLSKRDRCEHGAADTQRHVASVAA